MIVYSFQYLHLYFSGGYWHIVSYTAAATQHSNIIEEQKSCHFVIKFLWSAFFLLIRFCSIFAYTLEHLNVYMQGILIAFAWFVSMFSETVASPKWDEFLGVQSCKPNTLVGRLSYPRLLIIPFFLFYKENPTFIIIKSENIQAGNLL